MNECFISTKSTQQTSTIDWPVEEAIVTFQSNNCVLSAETLDENIKEALKSFKNEDTITNEVTVTIVNLTWMFEKGKSFLDFVKILHESKRSEIFASELVKSLQEHFWQENFSVVLYLWFLPFVVYFFTNISFTLLAL